MSFQQLTVAAVATLQHAHLLYGNPVEPDEAFALRQALADENGIEVLHVRETDEFVDGGVVADVVLAVGIGLAPLTGRHAEHRHVKHVCLVGIYDVCLRLRYFRGNEVLPDGVGMYPVVYLRQLALGRPAELRLLLGLQTLIFFDKQQLELWRNPHTEMVGYISVCVCAAITPGLRLYSDCVGTFYPCFHGKDKVITSRFIFNCTEFGTIKNGIIQYFLLAKVFDGALQTEPSEDDILLKLAACHVCKADVIFFVVFDKAGVRVLNGNLCHWFLF